MRLTFTAKMKLCWEIMTITSGHAHTALDKQLSTFQRGYAAGVNDARLMARESPCGSCANRGKVDGLSQESNCEHCIHQQSWRTDHYLPDESVGVSA
jgi:hypothetical protein